MRGIAPIPCQFSIDKATKGMGGIGLGLGFKSFIQEKRTPTVRKLNGHCTHSVQAGPCNL